MIQGEWVGQVDLHGSHEFVRLEVSQDLSGAMEWPNQLRFRCPVLGLEGDPDTIQFDVGSDPRGPLVFTVQHVGDLLHGVVIQGDVRGSCWLRPSATLDLAQYHRFVGDYTIGAARHVTLGLNSDPAWGGPYAFYTEADRVVRLHPIAVSTFLSENLESVSLISGQDDEPTVRWEQHGDEGPAVRAPSYREEPVRFASDTCELAGTLLLPHGSGPHPAVVLVHGSLPSTRDFYRLWAERFVRAGIAALVYDKRGFGESTGSGDSSIADRAEDAEAGLTYLQGRRDIDPLRVGLWGFSNGTWSIPLVAARRPDVAFMIAVGAVGVSPARAELHRKLFELREWDIRDETLRQVEQAWEIIYRYVATGEWDDDWDHTYPSLVTELSQAEALRHIQLPQYAVDNPWLSPIPPLIPVEQIKANYRGVVPDMGVDPVSAYTQVQCPVLFLIGEHDSNVPVKESVQRVTEALHDAGNPGYTVQIVPAAGHLLNVVGTSISGMSAEECSYRLHAFRFAPGVMDGMAAWAAERVSLLETPTTS